MSNGLFVRATFVTFGNVARNTYRAPSHLIGQSVVTSHRPVVSQFIDCYCQGFGPLPDNQFFESRLAHRRAFLFDFHLSPIASCLSPPCTVERSGEKATVRRDLSGIVRQPAPLSLFH